MLFHIFFVLFSICRFSKAMTDDEVKMELTKNIMRCTKDFPVEVIELINLQLRKTPTVYNAKCLLACAYRIEGSMNAKGIVDPEHIVKRAVDIAGDDEKRLERARKLNEICVKVNDEKVSDGEKGCDRGALYFACQVKNAPKLGFKT